MQKIVSLKSHRWPVFGMVTFSGDSFRQMEECLYRNLQIAVKTSQGVLKVQALQLANGRGGNKVVFHYVKSRYPTLRYFGGAKYDFGWHYLALFGVSMTEEFTTSMIQRFKS